MIAFGMATKKRQDLPAGLWVVATPLGNLGDLSDRARAALAESDRVLCEDTRRTGALMHALGISARLERFDAHAGPAEVAKQIERLREGESLALVTDAGTPAVSDPGARLVAAAHEAGILVTPVPGPSAVTTLLSVAGFPESEFAFGGFFPRKPGERERLAERLRSAAAPRVWVFFESPQRVVEALESLAQATPGARLVAAKELTKLHERLFWGEVAEVAREVAAEVAREGEIGEWAFAWCAEGDQPEEHADEGLTDRFQSAEVDLRPGAEPAWALALHCLSDCGVAGSDAAKAVAKRFAIDRKLAYETLLRLQGKK